jgi:hypothetical protein
MTLRDRAKRLVAALLPDGSDRISEARAFAVIDAEFAAVVNDCATVAELWTRKTADAHRRGELAEQSCADAIRAHFGVHR